MRRSKGRSPIRTILGGVSKYLPFLALPMCILFVETSLQLGIFRNDYLSAQLKQECAALRNGIKSLRAEQANLGAMRRLDVMADRLGLVPPSHGQIEIIPMSMEGGPGSEGAPMAYARLGAGRRHRPRHVPDTQQ